MLKCGVPSGLGMMGLQGRTGGTYRISNDLNLQTADEIGTGDLCLHSVARAKRHCHKLAHGAMVRGDAVQPELTWGDSVVPDGLVLRHELVAASTSLLGVCRRLTRHSVDATNIDLDGKLALGVEANPHRLALCVRVCEHLQCGREYTYGAWEESILLWPSSPTGAP